MSRPKLSDKQLEGKVEEFQSVISSRKNMSAIKTDKVFLLRLLKFYNGNMEKALKRLTVNMELRKSYSNIFFDRDTLNPRMRKLIDQVEMVFMPKVTPENHRIILIRLIDFVPENLVFEDALIVFTMMSDVAIITPEEEGLADGDILIFDFKGFSARHLARIGISSLRCFIKYLTEAHPLRIKGVHIVNSHSLLDKFFILAKPFLGAKAMEIIHFHLPNSSTLFDFVPKNCLPHEFEGTFGPIETLKWFWINRTDDHRDYLLDDTRWKFTEIKSNQENSSTDDEAMTYLGFC